MDKRQKLDTPPGVKIRELVSGDRIQIAFTYEGRECRELLPAGPVNKSSIQRAAVFRDDIRDKIKAGTFVYGDCFPDSPRAEEKRVETTVMRTLLHKQLNIYERQVQNDQLAQSTHNGYAKSINSERMKLWHDKQVADVTPSMLRE